MAKTIFEQIDGTYTLQGDYYLPDLTEYSGLKRPDCRGSSTIVPQQ